MKHILSLLPIAIFLIFICGCNDSAKTNKVKPIMVTDEDPHNMTQDTTKYGRCCETSTMNVLYIVDAKGDTLDFIIEDGENVYGGILPGDKMAVISENQFDENIAKKVINTMSLMGRWTSLDKDFEIKDGGVIESHQPAESKTFTSWKIFNGQLILAPDTFDINMLGPDSMKLENKNGIYGFKRMDMRYKAN